MTDFEHWIFNVNDHIATLTLNRPDVRNTLLPESLQELATLTQRIADDDNVWAVVIQSAGDHFSVGVDVTVIQNMVGQIEAIYRHNISQMQAALNTFEQLNKPTIAKIKGYCLGGGLLMALCCDFRIVGASATFGFPEVKRGIPILMGTQRVSRIAGVAYAKEMIMLGETFDAAKAKEYHLVNQIVPDAELDAAVETLADKFRHLPPRTVGIIKEIIDLEHLESIRDTQELEIDRHGDKLDSHDFREGVESFLEKRPPEFTGN